MSASHSKHEHGKEQKINSPCKKQKRQKEEEKIVLEVYLFP
jgi:hypothetical protein